MRIASLLVSAVILGVAACVSATSASGDLDGRWAWDGNNNPGGSSLNISLRTAGSNVTGTGLSQGIGPSSIIDSITITGQRFRTPISVNFDLTLNYAGGRVVTYSGQLVGSNELRGTRTEGNQSHTLIFYRE